jgi:hypothetical protein
MATVQHWRQGPGRPAKMLLKLADIIPWGACSILVQCSILVRVYSSKPQRHLWSTRTHKVLATDTPVQRRQHELNNGNYLACWCFAAATQATRTRIRLCNHGTNSVHVTAEAIKR